MKKIRYTLLYIMALLGFGLIFSCGQFLDELPNRKLAVPKKLDDLQQLLNNALLYGSGPNTPEILADDYYVTDASFNAVTDERIRNLYLWQREEHDSWDRMYRAVYHANVVLDHLGTLDYDPDREAILRNTLEGSALFLRSLYYYWILQIYAKPYSTDGDDLGIPLRYSADFNVATQRYPLEYCYEELLADLRRAAILLPEQVTVKTQPSRAAAWALLARVYLTMKDYEQTSLYADSCIQQYGVHNLLDFNNISDVDIHANFPFKVMNKEVIYHAIGSGNIIINTNNAKIDPLLLASYDSGDLRRTAYFRANTGTAVGTFHFKGNYDEGHNNIFYGLALDEVILMRAEAHAREGDTEAAAGDLDLLLARRWRAGEYVPYSGQDQEELIRVILAERRKSLIRRGLRWVDIRRLAGDAGFSVVPKRVIDGLQYTLDPLGDRTAVLIPHRVIQLSGIDQNR